MGSRGGCFPEGKEFNVMMDPKASVYTFSHWPTPILFSGFEIGNSILTGKRVAEMDSSHNPVAWASNIIWQHMPKRRRNRMSWDLTAVLCAVRDPERYFYVCGPVNLSLTTMVITIGTPTPMQVIIFWFINILTGKLQIFWRN